MRPAFVFVIFVFTAAFGGRDCALEITTPAGGNGVATSKADEGATSGTVETIVAADGSTSATAFALITETTDFEFATTTSGVLSVKDTANLDYETATTVVLTFTATLTTQVVTGTVTVSINDINDNTPTFASSSFRATVADAANEGTTVTTVTATDADSTSPNNVIGYKFTDASNTGNAFTVSSTGVITVSTGTTLNRAKESSYDLVLLATDTGTKPKPLTGSTTVSVCVGSADQCGNSAMRKTATAILMMLIALAVMVY